jgi:predicted protein tyrosine phosphatase|tara:strand:+ start:7807 stop:8163 length:357 start_codon:yes stop_codon:yes gene_type:complete
MNNVKKQLLFICANGLDRSSTAEELFEDSEEIEARSAGFFPIRDSKKITNQLIRWASTIIVMDEKNEFQKTQLLQKFPDAEEKEIIVLGIPDDFSKGDENLKKLLKLNLKKEVICNLN